MKWTALIDLVTSWRFISIAGVALIALPLLIVGFGMRHSVQANSVGTNGPVVVELFTSQGCNSCPPAEHFLTELAPRDDVIALEWHVDYWDYIGWADPFADRSFTERQRDYARNLGARYVYTPQMVIDGQMHEVGSRDSAIEKLIALRQRGDLGPQGPAVRLEQAGNKVNITIDAADGLPGIYDVMLVSFDAKHDTQVLRGENKGKTLTSAHVVRKAIRLDNWKGQAYQAQVPMAELTGDGGCALLVQRAGGGPIVAANMLRF